MSESYHRRRNPKTAKRTLTQRLEGKKQARALIVDLLLTPSKGAPTAKQWNKFCDMLLIYFANDQEIDEVLRGRINALHNFVMR